MGKISNQFLPRNRIHVFPATTAMQHRSHIFHRHFSYSAGSLNLLSAMQFPICIAIVFHYCETLDVDGDHT